MPCFAEMPSSLQAMQMKLDLKRFTIHNRHCAYASFPYYSSAAPYSPAY